MSDFLQPHRMQHSRPPCPLSTPRACSHICPSSQWCHPTISLLCRPLLLLPSIFPSIRVFSNESVLRITWPNYWSFSFSLSPSNEYSGLISFRIGWFDPLPVQGTLKSLFQHHSSKASILGAQSYLWSNSHISLWPLENHTMIMQNFVGKVMPLLLNTLSRFFIVFISRSMCLLISWLQSPSTVILEPRKIKSDIYTVLYIK